MSVVGIGIDISKTKDFLWVLEDAGSLKKLLNKSEITLLPKNKSASLIYVASIFACKEAIIKASQSLTIWDLANLIIVKENNSSPKLVFDISEDPRIIRESRKNWMITLSHEDDLCVAVAIAQV